MSERLYSMRLGQLTYCLFIFLALTSCKKTEEPDYLSGNIIVEPASRISNQFLISVENQIYYPINLPQEYQNPNFHQRPILVRFELTGNTQDIYVPAPNDIPVYGYTVQRVRILSIKDP